MTASAVYAFIGVLLGSATTAALTVYRERLLSTREREAREQQRQQDQKDQRNTFQRQSILALQDAVSDLIKALYDEQDRLLEEMRPTGTWTVRQWETPTATGWTDAQLRLQVFRARVFDEKLRELASDIHEVARKSVWASSPEEAKALRPRLGQERERFHDLVASTLSELYLNLETHRHSACASGLSMRTIGNEVSEGRLRRWLGQPHRFQTDRCRLGCCTAPSVHCVISAVTGDGWSRWRGRQDAGLRLCRAVLRVDAVSAEKITESLDLIAQGREGCPLLQASGFVTEQLLFLVAKHRRVLEVLGVDGTLLVAADLGDLLVELCQVRRGADTLFQHRQAPIQRVKTAAKLRQQLALPPATGAAGSGLLLNSSGRHQLDHLLTDPVRVNA
jgi:hypothetical protein